MFPSLPNLSSHERAVLLTVAAQVEQVCERPWIAAMKQKPEVVKVRAGFYRVGAFCIHKGHWWCCYLGDKPMPHKRFATLQEAVAWARHNQPKEPA